MDIIDTTEGKSEYGVQKYIIICLTVTFVISYAQYLWGRRYLYIHSWSVEGPLAFPLIGCGYLALGKGYSDILESMVKFQSEASSGLLRVWMGPKLIYFISKPEYIETVLNHPKALEKEDMYKLVAEYLGHGLLTAPVKKWKYHRKLIAPSFNQKILDTFVEHFAEGGTLLAEKLETMVGQKDFDLQQFVFKCTMDIVCLTSMGVSMNLQNEEKDYGALFDRCMEIFALRIFKIQYHSSLVWKFSSLRTELEAIVKDIQALCCSVVDRKLAAHEKQKALQQTFEEAEIEEEPVCKRLAFLDMVIEKSDFSATELQDEVNIFMIAGAETTANALCCLMTMLGMHPEIQQKVFEEVVDILGTDRTVEASDLSKMKYTERVVKETLRLFPVAGMFGRSVEEDIDLGDVILPGGVSIGINTPFIHRNPIYYTDPLKFDPDRFLPEEVAKRHPCAYIPFSYGQRNCIGWKYAIASMKTLIAILVRKYVIFTEYKSVEEIELKVIPLLKMVKGPKVWMEYR